MSVFDTQLRVGVGAELNRTSSLRARHILLRYYTSCHCSNSIGVHIAHWIFTALHSPILCPASNLPNCLQRQGLDAAMHTPYGVNATFLYIGVLAMKSPAGKSGVIEEFASNNTYPLRLMRPTIQLKACYMRTYMMLHL
jgi:hypothetical protein